VSWGLQGQGEVPDTLPVEEDLCMHYILLGRTLLYLFLRSAPGGISSELTVGVGSFCTCVLGGGGGGGGKILFFFI